MVCLELGAGTFEDTVELGSEHDIALDLELREGGETGQLAWKRKASRDGDEPFLAEDRKQNVQLSIFVLSCQKYDSGTNHEHLLRAVGKQEQE